MMKYIEIEFSNQPIVIPLFIQSQPTDDIIEDLINSHDVEREKRVSKVFEGTLIPPGNIWQAACERDAERKPSKTKILKKAIVSAKKIDSLISNVADEEEFKSPDTKKIRRKTEELYLQDKELRIYWLLHSEYYIVFVFSVYSDYGFLHFTKKQADFLRLLECVRLS